MHDRMPTTIVFLAAALSTVLISASDLQAQTRSISRHSSPLLSAAEFLSALANYRVVRWASASAVVRCAPAPLTERPGAHSEIARPRVLPLEEAFADAQSVRRAMAYRARAVALEKE